MDNKKYRLKIWFDGHVQGVGFRYKATEIAKGYEVSGSVENLDDGRVLLIAVGEKSEVDEYANEVSRIMADFIKTRDDRQDYVDSSPKGFSMIY